MIEIEKPTFTIAEISEGGTYGKFVLEPLERGFGTTLGNSLRRALLSSLQGTAVTSIKIDGVVHEFSTIPGVKEDVTQIVLNVKGLIAKLYSDEPKTLEIFAEGPCIVTGKSIRYDPEVEILNPDHVIATLNSDVKDFHMELVLDKGRGYVSAERNKELSKNKVLGQIAVDSIFTPVKKVNFTVEDARVGKITDYNRLTLEIWTNGVLTAKEALSMAGAIIIEHMKNVVNESDLESAIKAVNNRTNRTLAKSDSLAGDVTTIEDMELSVRASNCLKRAGIETMDQLLRIVRNGGLSTVRNCGTKSVDEIMQKLETYGFDLTGRDATKSASEN